MGGLADAAAGVGAERKGGLAQRHSGRTAARAAAGHAGEVVGVLGWTKVGILGGCAVGKGVQVGLGHEYGTGRPQPLDGRAFVGRHKRLQDVAGSGGMSAKREVVVLGDIRHASQRQVFAGGDARINLPGLLQGVRIELEHGVVLRRGSEAVQTGLHQLHGGVAHSADVGRQIG